MYRKIAIASLLAAMCCSAFAQNRVSATQKGSILIFPKIELRWNANGDLTQDTFIDIANDYTTGVHVTGFYVSERTWETIHINFDLTANQPIYWAVSNGLGDYPLLGIQPFFGVGTAYTVDETTDVVQRGYLVLIATNILGEPINFNHLYGQATLVNYTDGDAWEYNSYAFRALQGAVGQPIGTNGGRADLNGSQYDYAFQFLLFDYFATTTSSVFSQGGSVVDVDTDLTLMITDQDLTQDANRPYITKALFHIWNENENSFEAMYCVRGWDQHLISHWGTTGAASPFMIGGLHTAKGRARIEGVYSTLCNTFDDQNNPVDVSAPFPLLGVQYKLLTFNGTDIARAGGELQGSGTMSTCIKWDTQGPPPPEKKLIGAPVPATSTPAAPRGR